MNENKTEAVASNVELNAARYRFLREGGSYVVRCANATFYCGGHTVQKGSAGYAESFDKAVDEAMRSNQELTGPAPAKEQNDEQ